MTAATTNTLSGLSADTSRPARDGFAMRLRNWYNAYQTRQELSKLTDRELDDIGLTRFDIADAARATARY